MSKEALIARSQLRDVQRLVVKVGTRVLTESNGRPNLRRIKSVVRSLSFVRKSGREVVLVTSGAIAMGIQAMGLKTRPNTLPELQMAASVGQARLMAQYAAFFAEEGLKVGQVLLTHDDLKNRTRHLNARNAMLALLRNGVVPIVNENDVVAVDEIKLGDNDVLASLVSVLVEADLLVLLTSVEGFQRPLSGGRMVRVSYLHGISEDELRFARGKGSPLSVGGMSTKLHAAYTAVKAGALSVIADGRKPAVLKQILAGKDVGTLIGGGRERASIREHRKQWIAFFHKPQGALLIDDGARRALELRGKSLLPIGITSVRGEFSEGSLVTVESKNGEIVARGLVSYASDEIRKVMGRKTSEIASVLGSKHYDEIIHRDNMVLNGGEG